MKCARHATVILGTTALVAVSLACLAPPAALADAIVLVTATNNTVTGKNLCGASGVALCTETLNESFEWDNSTMSYVPGSLIASVTGNFSSGDTSTPDPGLAGCAVGNVVFINATDFFQLAIGCNPPGEIAPGSYNVALGYTDLSCGGIFSACFKDFGGINVSALSGTITATAVCFSPNGGPISCSVPEPATLGLFGLAGAFLGLRRHRRRTTNPLTEARPQQTR